MTPHASNWRAPLATARMAAVAAAALALAACGGAPSSSLTAQASTPAAQASTPAAQGQQVRGAGQDSAQPPATATSANCGAGRGSMVSTASQLRAALESAAPGSTIMLAPGVYQGTFKVTTSGTASAPVTLCGPRSAILDGGSISSGYTFYLDHASYWRVEGFTVQGGQKGVVTDASNHDLIYGLYVHDIGDEGIHLRDFSSYDTVSHNVVRDTGRYKSFFGEGIYVGSAHKNWCRYSGCQPDGSDYDTITGNNIASTTAENIDIKEGTVGGVIAGNHFNGVGMDPSSATSWVNVKGNDWKITGNTGVNSVQSGLSDHQVYPGWGMNNVFQANVLTVNGPGYGIFIQSKHLNILVACDNKVTGAQSGFSTIGCTSA